MSNIKASIVIPIFNQYEALSKVLKGFNQQDTSTDGYEIIVVDDGSTDSLINESSLSLHKKYNFNIEIIHKQNRGRAAARNTGVSCSQSDLIIFCDGDRIPHPSFFSEHLSSHENFNNIVVGSSYDYFGTDDKLNKSEFEWEYILKMSRLPLYYRKLQNLCRAEEQENNKYIWLSFLVGNSSIEKDLFNCVKGFDENIPDWGFEHFEIGYRLYKYGAKFSINSNAKSFHLPHKREQGFYNTQLAKGIDFMTRKHSELDANFLRNFFEVKEAQL